MLLHRSLLLASLLTVPNFIICMEDKDKPDNHKQVTTSKKKRRKNKTTHKQQPPALRQLESLDRSELKKLYFENASVTAPLTQEKKKASQAYQQKKKIFGILLSLNGGDKSKTNAELYGESEYSDDENNGFDLETRYRHSRNLLRYSIPATQQKLEEKKQQSDNQAKEISTIDAQIANLKKERKKHQEEQTELLQEIHYSTQATSIFLAKREADKAELMSQAQKKAKAAKQSEEKLKKITADKNASTTGVFDAEKTGKLSMQELEETKKHAELVQQHKAIEEKIKKLDGPTGWFGY